MNVRRRPGKSRVLLRLTGIFLAVMLMVTAVPVYAIAEEAGSTGAEVQAAAQEEASALTGAEAEAEPAAEVAGDTEEDESLAADEAAEEPGDQAVSLCDQYLAQIEAQAAAAASTSDTEQLEEAYNDLMEVYSAIEDSHDAGELSEEEYSTLYTAVSDAVGAFVAAGYDPYGTETLAGPGGTSSSSVDHIDIATALTMTIYINGTPYQVDYTLTSSDKDSIVITGAYNNGTEVTTTVTGTSTSTDNNGNAQLRLNGTFPVGTQNNPVYYTVSLTKNITITTADGAVTVPVTFTVEGVTYWSDANVCPGKHGNNVGGGAGIDLELGTASSTANYGTLTVQKTVAGVALTENKTYEFNIYSVSGETETLYDTVSVTVQAGTSTALAIETLVPYGTYKIIETGDAGIDGYTCTTTYGDTVTLNSSNASGALTVTNTYVKNTSSVTVEKVVAGNLSDYQEKFNFTATWTESGEVKSKTFQLAHNGSQTLNDLPIGTEVTITEASGDYTLTVTQGETKLDAGADGSVTVTVTEAPITLTFTNHKEATLNTGVDLDTLPYVLLLALALCGGTAMGILRRRRNG